MTSSKSSVCVVLVLVLVPHCNMCSSSSSLELVWKSLEIELKLEQHKLMT